MTKLLSVSACACAISGLLGFYWADTTPIAGVPPRVAAAAEPAASVQGSAVAGNEEVFCTGAQSDLGLELTPVRSIAGSGGPQLEFALAFDNRLRGSARLTYAVEVFDDLGQVVTPELVVSPLTVAADRSVAPDAVKTPAGLADGFYEMRVTAAGRAQNGDESGAVIREYLQVADGSIVPLSFDEWAALSRAEEGV